MAKKTGKRRTGESACVKRRTTPVRATFEAGAPAMPPIAEERAEDNSLTIVGVGASAGGLEAFTELLSHLPDDTGLAFVLIQHLDPSHESHLTELLSKASKMPVSEVTGETRAEANHVYVIPPRCNLGISDGILQTPPRPESGRNMPIDFFLRALAADRGSKALGVVLSGTASDGTLGLQAIKAAGGTTFAQEMQTAKCDGMPRSAIAAGVVDFVLPPAGIARQLVAIARDSQVPVEPREATEPPGDGELAKILRLVRIATGVDFANYKHGTLARRIKRRMSLRGFETLEDYSRDLEENREEANALCESCLITVTAFFREPAVFEELKKKVFPALVENRGPEDPIRIWVPGCATGEEATLVQIRFLRQRGGTSVRLIEVLPKLASNRGGTALNRVCSIFSQILSLIVPSEFKQVVEKHQAERHSRGFRCWGQFVAMLFCQLGRAHSLREICGGLAACEGKLKHLGLKDSPCRSTLAYANEHRPSEGSRDVFYQLMSRCIFESGQRGHGFRFKNKLLSMDASTVSLCVKMLDWAHFQRAKGAVKLHLVLDHDGFLPSYVVLTTGKTHEIKIARGIRFDPGTIVVFDQGYTDLKWWKELGKGGVFCVAPAGGFEV